VAKRAAGEGQSQQFRLQKPAPTATPTAPGPQPTEEATPPVAETTAPEVNIPIGTVGTSKQSTSAPTTPKDMEISPEEEAELLADWDVASPEDVDMEAVYDITIRGYLNAPTPP